jgi:hypothetical protein
VSLAQCVELCSFMVVFSPFGFSCLSTACYRFDDDNVFLDQGFQKTSRQFQASEFNNHQGFYFSEKVAFRQPRSTNTADVLEELVSD